MVRVWGPPEGMTLEQIVEGSPAEDRIRVRIAAVGVNFFEGLLIQGRYQVRPELPFVPGAEGAGVVEACPTPGRIRRGQRVAFLADIGRGTYAEMADIPPTVVVPIPDLMPSEEGAGLLTTYLTAHIGLHRRAQLQRGETLLVHAGAGGVGSAAIQLGKAAGARVIATAGTDEKVAFCLSLGADAALNYRDQDFVAAVKEFTGGRGADVILDMVGGPYVEKNLRSLAVEGRLVQIAFLQGSKVTLDLAHLMMRRQTITGSTLRPRPVAEKAAIARNLRDKVWPLIEAGKVRPVIDRTFPLAEAAAAHRLMESSAHIGKILLRTS